MIKRSIRIYIFGFLAGLILYFILLLTFPSLYYALLAALMKKTELQTEVLGGSQTLAITLNNLIASLIAAYGGYVMSKIFFSLNTTAQYELPRFFGMWGVKLKAIPREKRKYHMALYTFPTFVLFINGFVLGAFFTLYIENLGAYFANLLPHGFFEIPGILASGSIGLTIAEASVFRDGDLKENLERIARTQAPSYLIVVELLIVGAFMEVLTVT